MGNIHTCGPNETLIISGRFPPYYHVYDCCIGNIARLLCVRLSVLLSLEKCGEEFVQKFKLKMWRLFKGEKTTNCYSHFY